MSEQYVLFDLPSRDPCRCWSLNPWKTRMLLNFKGVDYRTEWVEYPDIKPTLEPHVPPHPQKPQYTIPTVRFPDGRYVMESFAIAREIEAAHPTPSARLDAPAVAELMGAVPRLLHKLRAVLLPGVPRLILNERSKPYWHETRSAMVGKALDEWEREVVAAGEPDWDGAEPVLREVTALLKKEAGGPFFLGNEVSYADFIWGGFLIFFDRLGVSEELLARTGDADAHRALLKGLEPWTERSDR
ncbi:hypothetical protein L209DRAFT_731631 [Thermothelomyces heterothallicus CBS 203.75]